MNNERLTILQLNFKDRAGGAEKVAYDLHRIFRARGHRSLLVVGRKFTDDPDVLVIDNLKRRRFPHGVLILVERWLGMQYLNYPGSHRIPELAAEPWDILHIHNLHGGYFDLAALPELSRRAPTVVMMHDEWLLTGHCGYTLGCPRWRNGCGQCPDLTTYPPIRVDATRFNHWRKRRIFERSRCHLTAPSRWLLDEATQGLFHNVPASLIYNGVNLTIFQPGNKAAARKQLALPQDARIVLFPGNRALRNRYKDGATLLQAFASLVRLFPESERPLFLAPGSEAQDGDSLGEIEAHVIRRPYVRDEAVMAAYYQAADVLAFATRADNCPLVVLEAMACGLPVVASRVGGLPELIQHREDGILVLPGDAAEYRAALYELLTDNDLARRLSRNAVEVARRRFDIRRQADEFLELYRSLGRQPRTAERLSNRIN